MREPATEADKHGFLQLVVPAAMHAVETSGIPVSITIAQAILESDWGRSQLALKAKNYFGIKDVNWDPGYAEFRTIEFEHGEKHVEMAKFEDFDSIEACFAAHARLLSRSPRYRPAIRVKHDPRAFVEALWRCGYSTDPNYPEKLWRFVVRYDLAQYDAQTQPKRETLA